MNKNAILNESHRARLNQFRKAVSDILKPHHDDDYLLRWLIARDFDITEAEKMIRKSQKYMYNVEAEDILDSDYEVPEIWNYFPSRFWGSDNEGSPVRIFYPGKFDAKGYCRSLTMRDHMRLIIFKLHSDLRRTKENAEKTGKFNQKFVYLFDCKDLSAQQYLDRIAISRGIQMVLMYQDNFPELLKVCYVINAPYFLPKLVAIIKPFINQRTWEKIRFYSSGELPDEFLDAVDAKIVPRCYGGELSDPYYDPSIVFPRIKVAPVSYYIKDEFFLKPTDSKTKEIVVQQRDTFNFKVNVQKVKTILKWIFQCTKSYNIKFGVLFQTSKGNEDSSAYKELVKSKFIDSYYIPERGELLCETTGEYILHFDNTYSWFVKKHLLLRVDIEEPMD